MIATISSSSAVATALPRYYCRTVAAALAILVWFAVTLHISIQSSSSSSSSFSASQTMAISSMVDSFSATSSDDFMKRNSSTTFDGIMRSSAAAAAAAAADDDDDDPSSSCHGKEPLLQILQDAGVPNAADHCPELPTWKQIVDLYGPELVVVDDDGLESSCTTYRNMIFNYYNGNHQNNSNNNNTTTINSTSVVLPRIAGLFNTGTNALAKLLQRNLQTIEQSHYFYYDVPWGKHVPYHKRWNVTLPKHNPTPKSLVLPIVLIRDPYWWMQSMCQTSYGVKWKHTKKHCPNLTPDDGDDDDDDNNNNATGKHNNNNYNKSVPVVTKYSTGRGKNPVRFQWHHESLVHLWNDFYEEYYYLSLQQHQQQPRIVVRFEDMLFHGPRLLEKLATCLQLPIRKFEYITETSKQHHGSGTTLLSALVRYGSTQGRTKGMNQRDLEYARQHLNGDLLQRFHYRLA